MRNKYYPLSYQERNPVSISLLTQKLPKNLKRQTLIPLLVGVLLMIGGYYWLGTDSAPTQVSNACSIFQENPEWRQATAKVEKKWGVPASTQLAFIYQESTFQSDVEPPRSKLWGLIPWFRSSSAHGYTQALDHTWEQYLKSTHQTFASRESFEDAADFIGWYVHSAHKRLHVPYSQTKALYLAYHDGIGHYEDHKLPKSKWLAVAGAVEKQAMKYRQQLVTCRIK